MCVLRSVLLGLVVVASLVTSAIAAPVHFVAELGAEVNVDELEAKFVKAMNLMGSNCDASDIDIKVIDYGHYKYLSSLISSTAPHF